MEVDEGREVWRLGGKVDRDDPRCIPINAGCTGSLHQGLTGGQHDKLAARNRGICHRLPRSPKNQKKRATQARAGDKEVLVGACAGEQANATVHAQHTLNILASLRLYCWHSSALT